MNHYQLARLAQRASRMAYRVRHQQEQRADTEQIARAWQRLEDAAFALEAVYARRAAFDPTRVPPLLQDGSEPADYWPQDQG